MNKYHQILQHILLDGKMQQNKKGGNKIPIESAAVSDPW